MSASFLSAHLTDFWCLEICKHWERGTIWKRGTISLRCPFCCCWPHKHTALLGTGKQKLWIGLVLDSEHGWQWTDGKPFRYLRWTAGKLSLVLSFEKCKNLKKKKKTLHQDSVPLTPELQYWLSCFIFERGKKNNKNRQITGVCLHSFPLKT